jgi:leucyl aminopeptidase
MTAKIIQNQPPIDEASASQIQHLLMVLPQKKAHAPLNQLLEARLKRRDAKYDELAKAPVAADLAGGGRVVWVVADAQKSAFERNTALRKALALLLEEGPSQLTIAVFGDESQRKTAAEAAIYVALVNAAELPTRKKKSDNKPLKKIVLHGWQQDDDFVRIKAVAEGNTLTRTLSVLPPNELTPGIYRDKIKELAEQHGWKHEEFDMKKLRKLGAGAFVAVAQGSDPEDAAIVHLTYTPEKIKKHIALVGKGICFDTGGHNLKPARYMQGMHEDMNGSAVVLGTLLAATKSKLPIKIDCWLALAQNHISAKAYKQNDVVKALNGMTIEVVHTDAEGRMVLSDTLTLASRGKPEAMIDYATLTGSMVTALGTRYSGVLGNRPELLQKAIAAGQATGERVCAFPFDEDYDPELDSKIADIKQCTLDGEADHILAARFLSKFIENDVPWLHVDLSAVTSKGGLGAVASDTTGFGVALSLALLQEI